MKPTLDEVKIMAMQAGVLLRARFGKRHQIHHKGVIDLVTEVDQQSESFLLGQIQSKYPEHTIVAEESGTLNGKDRACWYIDPVDGTSNYAHGLPFFCVSLAFADEEGLLYGVVYDPIRDECFSAERGKGAWLNDTPIHVSAAEDLVDCLLATGFPYDIQTSKVTNQENFERFNRKVQAVRRLGSAALHLAYVAAGRLDGIWMINSQPWDIAAGAILVQEAGGTATNLYGEDQYLKKPYSLVAANSAIYTKMMETLKV